LVASTVIYCPSPGVSTGETKLLIIRDFPRGGKAATIDPERTGDLDLPDCKTHLAKSGKRGSVKRKKFHYQI
jgi:hypothetical protein